MGVIAIACYRPRPGKDEDLHNLVREHVPILRAEGLVTDREPVAMRAVDGTFVEVFEWVSQEAIGAAHANPAVHALWLRYEAACEYVKLADLSESSQMFPCFTPVVE